MLQAVQAHSKAIYRKFTDHVCQEQKCIASLSARNSQYEVTSAALLGAPTRQFCSETTLPLPARPLPASQPEHAQRQDTRPSLAYS